MLPLRGGRKRRRFQLRTERQILLEIATELICDFQKPDVVIRPLPQVSLFNELEDARGGGERNGERCGRRERRSVSVMVKENGIENEGCKRREERVGEDIGRRG